MDNNEKSTNTYSFSEIKKAANKMVTCLNLSMEIDKKILDETLEIADKIAVSCRCLINELPSYDKIPNEFKEKKEDIINYFSISYRENILHIYCPYTLKRATNKYASQKNYLIQSRLNLELKKWQKDNHFSLKKSINSPYVILIIRTGDKYDRSKICDNDNIENGRIVNEIAEVLGYSDNAMQMDLYSCFRTKKDAKHYGTEFVVCSRKDFLKAYKSVVDNEIV